MHSRIRSLRVSGDPEPMRVQLARVLGINPEGPLGKRILNRVLRWS